ncbi:hypothetical protein IAT38_001085 [Cryptococcus sp. DSM 104549]
MAERKPTLIIYGANSFTAQQLLTYLEAHPDAPAFDFILAGRSPQKLEAVNGKLKTKHEVVVCELTDREAVERLVDRGDVVINFAGPYRWHNAERLIAACAQSGTHYLDLCGESAWLATDIVPKYHSIASSSGACIVPACGFDSVPSDLTVYLANQTLQAAYPGSRFTSSTSLFKLKGSIAGGTVQTLCSVADLPWSQRQNGEFDLCPGVTTPSALGISPTYTLPRPHPRHASFFLMFPFNRCIVRRSQFLSGQLDPKSEKREVEYNEGLDLGLGWLASGLVSVLIWAWVGCFFGSRVLRNLFLRYMPKAGEGASLEKLNQGHYTVTNLSIAPAPSTTSKAAPIQVLTTFHGEGDPGYLNTCYLLAESALSLLLPSPPGTALPPLAKTGGVLTASTAFGDVLVQRLRASGKFDIQSEVVEKKGKGV